MKKTDQEWQAILTEEEFNICRLGQTEPPYTGKWLHNKQTGVYQCICCQAELFDSENKYDSGCGWPSFDQAIKRESIRFLADNSHGMSRVEIRCAQCDSHLGHVFPDGPQQTTGERYCVNSVSIQFEHKEK